MPNNTFPHEPAPRPVLPEPDDAHPVAVVAQEDGRGNSGITDAPVREPGDAHPVPDAPPPGSTQP